MRDVRTPHISESHISGEPDDNNDPKNGNNWGKERHIRSELVRWLCTTQSVRSLIDPKGIQIQYAKVSGKLDLAYVTVCFPLVFDHCAMPEDIDLSDAETRLLDFSGTHSGSIFGDNLIVNGELRLHNTFRADGEVRFLDASIKGSLNCSGGWFLNSGGYALSADRFTVDVSVFLNEGFRADGEVRLPGAHIKGDLNCRNGRFFNYNGENALVADSVTVEGSVFLNEGFWAHGTVRLVSANIKRVLACQRGRFFNCSGENALVAENVTVDGSVFLNEGFRAYAGVYLLGANIKGGLNCEGGWFLSQGGFALDAPSAMVEGNIFLNKDFRAYGGVRLLGAHIKGQLNCEGGRFLNSGGVALNATNIIVDGSVFLNEGFWSDAEILLLGAHIKGQLNCGGGWFLNSGGVALNAENVTVDGSVFLNEGFRTNSKLSLVNTTVGHLVDSTDCWPRQSNLFIHGFVYTTIEPSDVKTRLCWLEQQPSTPFYPQPYEQFAQVLRRIGHETNAKRVAIARENARLKKGDLPWWSCLWKQVLRITIRHGYMPGWALAWVLGFVLFGGILFYLGDAQGLMTPAKGPTYESGASQPTKKLAATYQTLNPWVYSLDAFLPIINLHQHEYWLPNPNSKCKLLKQERHCGAFLRAYLWVHIGFGWVLTTLFVIGFSGLVRRD